MRCLQIVDSGLDQESCFFRDEDGEHVDGGHYYDEVASGSNYFLVDFNGGYYPHDLTRRKVHTMTRGVAVDRSRQRH